MEGKDNKILTGVVIYQQVNTGSKSEVEVPMLYLGKGHALRRIYLIDDNPFESGGISKFDGMKVAVVVRSERNDVIEIESIKAV